MFCSPTTKKAIKAIQSDGMVVIIIYLIWSNRGTLAVDDANTVVSDRAEILSPKYAPDIIAPATQPSEKPCAVPIPISATPIVAIVVHELPVSRDTTAHIKQAVTKKTFG